MKRGLILIMTLALLLSAVPAVSGAEPEGWFADWPLIQEKAAVAMLTDLGLVSGYDDGTFQAGRPVTRAEAAKMIAGLLEGEVPEGGECRYPDAAGTWAAGYIELCAERGIVSGPAGSNYRPKDEVTVRELAKMLLAVLGHNTERCTGPDWAAETDALANAAGLYSGDEADKGRAATREETCLLFNNALQSSVIQGYNESGEPVYELDEMLQPKTLLELRFNAIPVTGVVQATGAGDLRTGGEKLERGCIHLSGYVKDFRVSGETAQDKSLLGHRVTVYARFGTEVNQVLGLPAISPDEISHEAAGQTLLDAVLSVGSLTFDGGTSYYRNCEPGDAACLENLGEKDQAILIDHDGDRRVDLVLVYAQDQPEE